MIEVSKIHHSFSYKHGKVSIASMHVNWNWEEWKSVRIFVCVVVFKVINLCKCWGSDSEVLGAYKICIYIYTFLYTISVIAIKIYSTLQLELSQVAVVVFAETFFCSNYYFKAKAKKKTTSY